MNTECCAWGPLWGRAFSEMKAPRPTGRPLFSGVYHWFFTKTALEFQAVLIRCALISETKRCSVTLARSFFRRSILGCDRAILSCDGERYYQLMSMKYESISSVGDSKAGFSDLFCVKFPRQRRESNCERAHFVFGRLHFQNFLFILGLWSLNFVII